VEAIKETYDDQILMLTGIKSIKYEDLLAMIKEIFNNEIEIRIHPKKSATHYKMSPYSFNPKMAKKIVKNPHVDLGQGLLDLIGKIHNEHNSEI